jgi:hypothetical protein
MVALPPGVTTPTAAPIRTTAGGIRITREAIFIS